MLETYHVKYRVKEEIKTVRVRAHHKQQAYNFYRNKYKYPVVDIINYDKIRRIRKFVLCVLAVIIAICCFVTLIAHAQAKHTPVEYEVHVVRSGDTLWDIAKTSNGFGELDTRCIVMDMCKQSACDATIHSGDVIYVPVYNID